MERKDMQKSMYPQRRVVLAYLVAPVTIASAALAANTAIEPASNAGNTNWMARHQAMNARAKQGHVDLIYVGDSIVQLYEKQGKDTWDRYYAPRNAVNLGISWDRTEHVLWRLDYGNIDGISPKLAIVMIGQNNGPHNTAAEIGAGVTAVVQKIHLNCPLPKSCFWQSSPGAKSRPRNARSSPRPVASRPSWRITTPFSPWTSTRFFSVQTGPFQLN
jgi:GDSL-like lipase/acylhydrolase family protein